MSHQSLSSSPPPLLLMSFPKISQINLKKPSSYSVYFFRFECGFIKPRWSQMSLNARPDSTPKGSSSLSSAHRSSRFCSTPATFPMEPICRVQSLPLTLSFSPKRGWEWTGCMIQDNSCFGVAGNSHKKSSPDDES
ncbi:hypothetical protein ADUPG1_001087, partial [Aduncisulcus paluster]